MKYENRVEYGKKMCQKQSKPLYRTISNASIYFFHNSEDWFLYPDKHFKNKFFKKGYFKYFIFAVANAILKDGLFYILCKKLCDLEF